MPKEPLQAISNVIRLEPGKKYLLVFSGEQAETGTLRTVMAMLRQQGIIGVGVALKRGQKLEVIEFPDGREEGT